MSGRIAGSRSRFAGTLSRLLPSGRHAIDPRVFAPGACVAFPPAAAGRHLTVFLDAGHGGVDPGAVGSTESGRIIYEADLALAVELDTMATLRREDLRVVVSRTSDTSVICLRPGDAFGGNPDRQGLTTMSRPETCANDARANVLVGFYFDAGAPSNAGCLTGYDALRRFAADNLRLATLVQNDTFAATNTVFPPCRANHPRQQVTEPGRHVDG